MGWVRVCYDHRMRAGSLRWQSKTPFHLPAVLALVGMHVREEGESAPR